MVIGKDLEDGCSNALIVRDENSPTTQEWEEQRGREQDERRWEEWKRRREDERLSERRWARIVLAMMAATFLFAGVVAMDIVRDNRSRPSSRESPARAGATSNALPRTEDDISVSDSEDTSPITDPGISDHQDQFGGMATLDTKTGLYSLSNRFTGEEITTVSELRKYQQQLQACGQRGGP